MNGAFSLYAMIALMVFFWSANFIIAKVALREFPPLLLAGVRVALAAAMILPAYLRERRRSLDRWSREDLPFLIILGLFGVALNQLFFVLGLDRTSVAHSSIIIGMTPVMVLLIAAFLGMERITGRKAGGLAIALGGVAALKIFEAHPAGGAGPTWLGDFLALCGALSFALFTVYAKRATKSHSAVTVNTFGYVGGALAMAPVTVWQGWRFPFARVTAAGWVALFYMALISSVVCYLIFYHALSHIPASRLSAFSYLQPLIATLMGVYLLHEHVTGPLVAAGAVIFTGVYLTERG